MRDKKGRFIKGYKPSWTEESRKKVSNSMRGVNTWMKGRKLKKVTRKRMSKNNARYWLGKKRLDMTGNLHPNWKEHKLLPLYRAIRESFKYRTWRSEVIKSDKHICRLCGIINRELHADHFPKSFSNILNEYNITTFNEAIACKELWDLNN